MCFAAVSDEWRTAEEICERSLRDGECDASAPVQPVAGVLRRVRRGWRLLDVGGILNCADAPIRVFRDLHLTPCLAGNQTRF